MGLESCTAEVQLANEFTLDGRMVTLIDTPGFDDTTKSDTEILKMIGFFLANTSVCIGVHHTPILLTEPLNRYEEGSTLAGVIYVHRISDNRFGGITGRNFNMFRKLCGESTLKNVVLVTNMWKRGSQDTNTAREKELSDKFFKPTLNKGAQMIRHHNTTESAHDIIRRIMKNHPVVLQIQRELVDEGKDIINTAAGDSINRELKDQIERHQAELKGLREEMMRALKEKDEETRRELEEAKRKLEEQMERIMKAAERMAVNYAAEKERMAAKMKEMEQELKQERERAEAEYDRKLAALARHIQRTPNAADRAEWEQEIKRLQDRVAIPIYKCGLNCQHSRPSRKYS